MVYFLWEYFAPYFYLNIRSDLMAIITFFTSPIALEILGKLLIAFLLSLVIGMEREFIQKPAGIKTHTLICISSCLVMSLRNIFV